MGGLAGRPGQPAAGRLRRRGAACSTQLDAADDPPPIDATARRSCGWCRARCGCAATGPDLFDQATAARCPGDTRRFDRAARSRWHPAAVGLTTRRLGRHGARTPAAACRGLGRRSRRRSARHHCSTVAARRDAVPTCISAGAAAVPPLGDRQPSPRLLDTSPGRCCSCELSDGGQARRRVPAPAGPSERRRTSRAGAGSAGRARRASRAAARRPPSCGTSCESLGTTYHGASRCCSARASPRSASWYSGHRARSSRSASLNFQCLSGSSRRASSRSRWVSKQMCRKHLRTVVPPATSSRSNALISS